MLQQESEELDLLLNGTADGEGSLVDRIRAVLDQVDTVCLNDDKDRIRMMHSASTQARLKESHQWILSAWKQRSHYFADGKELTPARIDPVLVQVETKEHNDLFRLGRYTWSLPYSRGYGRRLRFLIFDRHHQKLIGILGLQSPPIDFAPRDQRVNYPQGRKVEMVNQTMDIFTLGAIPPYNRLLGGKLVVCAASSQEILLSYQERYHGATTQMQNRIIPAHLPLLTTTSAFGRSSIYNRVNFRESPKSAPRAIAIPIGYTKGFGNFHLDELYPDIRNFLLQQGKLVQPGFGSGPKPIWQNIKRAMTMLNINGRPLRHGIQRQAWAIPLAENAWEYLSNQAEEPSYYRNSFEELSQWWKERWLMPRSERISDWKDWKKEALIESLALDS